MNCCFIVVIYSLFIVLSFRNVYVVVLIKNLVEKFEVERVDILDILGIFNEVFREILDVGFNFLVWVE